MFHPSNIEIAVFTRLLAYEAGVFKPLDVAVPRVPEDACPVASHVRNGFALLIGLRWRDGDHVPVPFSARFAGAWCGLSRRKAHEAIVELRRMGVIREAGRVGRLRLYLPGGSLEREAVEMILGENH